MRRSASYEVGEDLQQQSFAMLPRVRREVATIDLDSSIHEVYGEKKEGADFAYNNTWSYSVLRDAGGDR